MFLHDAIADAQSQARALTYALGRVERIEDALGVLESGAIVRELRADVPVLPEDFDLHLARAPGFKNGIYRIVQDVEEYLLDLMRIGNHHGRLGRSFALHSN